MRKILRNIAKYREKCEKCEIKKIYKDNYYINKVYNGSIYLSYLFKTV